MGSHFILAPTPIACFVDGIAPRVPRPYPQHSASFSAPCFLSGWKRDILGVRTQPPRLRPNPTFSPANSPVSPVDRSRLLTASSKAGCQEWHATAVATDSKNLNSAEADFTAPYTRFGACLLRLGCRTLSGALRRSRSKDVDSAAFTEIVGAWPVQTECRSCFISLRAGMPDSRHVCILNGKKNGVKCGRVRRH